MRTEEKQMRGRRDAQTRGQRAFRCIYASPLLCISFSSVLSLAVIFQITACGEGQVAPRRESLPANTPSTKTSITPIKQKEIGINQSSQEIPVYTIEVINSWPHDPQAYTQGLVFFEGALFESTGLHGLSSLRKVDLRSGKVLKKVDVSSQYFAEGMTIFQGKIYQLTWQSRKGFIYDLKDFKPQGEFSYDGEGWGLTHDDQYLIMSDGTNRIRFLNPVSFKVEKTISVYDNRAPLMELNELEYIRGEIYANIWQKNRLVRLDPSSGKILGWIDLTGLRPPDVINGESENVLNGIAYDEAKDRLFVTGKRWPKIFEIRLKRK